MKRYKKRYMPVNTAQNEHWGMANAPDLGFTDINKHLEMLRDGDIVGRAVMTFAKTAEPRREKGMVA